MRWQKERTLLYTYGLNIGPYHYKATILCGIIIFQI